jgi:hypothetical protein
LSALPVRVRCACTYRGIGGMASERHQQSAHDKVVITIFTRACWITRERPLHWYSSNSSELALMMHVLWNIQENF